MDLPNHLNWLFDKILQHSNYSERFGDNDNVKLWILWAVRNNFVVMNDPPTYGIIARPVSFNLYNVTPKGEELWAFDHTGDALWMDFLWAPGQWSIVQEFLRVSGKRWGGWEHRTTGKMHIVDIHKLVTRSIQPDPLRQRLQPLQPCQTH
jgi:hypothetical protein